MEKFKKAVTFSYDDGGDGDKKLVEIFNKYNMKCTFNLISGRIGKGEAEELLRVYSGHEIAMHGREHLHPNALEHESYDTEYGSDRKALSTYFSCDINGAAYPYGEYNDDVISYLRNIGIKYARTTLPSYGFDIPSDLMRISPTCHQYDEKLPELLESFIALKADEPRILYIWGHSYEFEMNNNFYILEDICRRLSESDDILFGTNYEVFRYFNLLD